MLKKFIIIAICGICTFLQTQAQTPAESDESAEADVADTVSCSIRIYRWAFNNKFASGRLDGSVVKKSSSAVKDTTDSSVLWYKSGNDWHSISSTTGPKTFTFNYKGTRQLDFYTKIESSMPGSEPTYKKKTSVTLPVGATEAYMLLFKQGESIRFFPMNVSPDVFPKGKLAVLNMTAKTIAISLGGQAQQLTSRAYKVFAPEKKGNGSIDIKIANFIDEKWRILYENSISPADDKRCILLIYDPNNKKRPTYYTQLLRF